ncbi:Uncharacterised protein [Mycobacterium tuberculosis]|uniref:Uncharacterized protein n=1 Tax=Mycobacterium tuberculosis TaxID=1773 RepID=A0A0U0RBW2_MYCTX|nr:Uncharacterised protein [Mycobacterium tuberculosis]COV92180.1 Uncharacterised protein [Mycobacterium tuberculosis]COW64453.1 Uncharacterised protein [Mycobacterium tuberculosis]COX57004.1 Uncharacterised protein [Mycobacterium tuberculosis]
MFCLQTLPTAAASSSVMPSSSAGSITTSTPSRSASSRNSNVVNAACSGPRRPTITTSWIPRGRSDSKA